MNPCALKTSGKLAACVTAKGFPLARFRQRNCSRLWLLPEITLTLDPMELGLSQRYGASWRERMQFLLERLGPFRLAYLEGLLRAADCRASDEEDQRAEAGAKQV